MLSVDGEMRRDEGCIDYAGQYVMIFPCHGMKGNQEWVYGLVRMFTEVVYFLFSPAYPRGVSVF